MRRRRVSLRLAEVTQHIHSLRASGVMPAHASFTIGSDSIACRKSAGRPCTVPPAIGSRAMVLRVYRPRAPSGNPQGRPAAAGLLDGPDGSVRSWQHAKVADCKCRRVHRCRLCGGDPGGRSGRDPVHTCADAPPPRQRPLGTAIPHARLHPQPSWSFPLGAVGLAWTLPPGDLAPGGGARQAEIREPPHACGKPAGGGPLDQRSRQSDRLRGAPGHGHAARSGGCAFERRGARSGPRRLVRAAAAIRSGGGARYDRNGARAGRPHGPCGKVRTLQSIGSWKVTDRKLDARRC